MSDPKAPMLVRITDPNHPHYPEHGKLTGSIIRVCGKLMAELKLDCCAHGISGCYVESGQVEIIPGRSAGSWLFEEER